MGSRLTSAVVWSVLYLFSVVLLEHYRSSPQENATLLFCHVASEMIWGTVQLHLTFHLHEGE